MNVDFKLCDNENNFDVKDVFRVNNNSKEALMYLVKDEKHTYLKRIREDLQEIKFFH